jgi:nicotinate (nicotinamide) nucleotide adenylyltransferase
LKKIGILAGTFDPVHKGHIAFALQAAKVAGLERVYLLPERTPRIKKNVTEFAHRSAMLRLAVRDHEELEVLELPEPKFTISVTLPKLRAEFAPAQVVFLLGSDVAANLGNWPGLSPLIIGLRRRDKKADIQKQLGQLKIPGPMSFIDSPQAHAASTHARLAKDTESVDPAVLAYIKAHNLFPE